MAATKTKGKGNKPDKLMADAIRIALKREAKDADGKPTRKLNLVATKLVDLAVDGDIQAIKEICDRIDGKAMQGIEMSSKDGTPLVPAINVTIGPESQSSS